MRNIFHRQEFNRKYEVSESDGYCPSIQNVLFKEHKLEELLVENKLKGLGLQTAQSLIKALYEELKRLEIQNFQYRSELQEIARQFKEQEKLLKREITYLKHKLLIEKNQNKISENKQKERRFSQSKQYLTNILILDESRGLSIPNSYNSVTKYSPRREPTSPIRKMGFKEAVSKEYVEIQNQRDNKLWNWVKNTLLSDQLNKILVDFETISQVIYQQKDQLKVYREQFIKNEIQMMQISKQMDNYGTTSTKPNYSQKSQNFNWNNSSNRKFMIRGKKLFSTENFTETTPQRVKFEPFFQGKCVQKKNQHQKRQKNQGSSLSEIIKEYEQIIQQYKEYSAYLRAYLCSCIGYIGKQTQQLQQENHMYEQQATDDFLSTDKLNFPLTLRSFNNIFPAVLKDIQTTVSQKFLFEQEIRKQVEKENKQLKYILDELITNLKLSGFSGLTQMKDKRYDHKHEKDYAKNKSKPITNDEKNSKNKDSQININKPIIHQMTITEANNYYHSIK